MWKNIKEKNQTELLNNSLKYLELKMFKEFLQNFIPLKEGMDLIKILVIRDIDKIKAPDYFWSLVLSKIDFSSKELTIIMEKQELSDRNKELILEYQENITDDFFFSFYSLEDIKLLEKNKKIKKYNEKNEQILINLYLSIR